MDFLFRTSSTQLRRVCVPVDNRIPLSYCVPLQGHERKRRVLLGLFAHVPETLMHEYNYV